MKLRVFFLFLMLVLFVGCDDKPATLTKVGTGTCYVFDSEGVDADVFINKLNELLRDNPNERIVAMKAITKQEGNRQIKVYLVITDIAKPGESRAIPPIPSLTPVEQ